MFYIGTGDTGVEHEREANATCERHQDENQENPGIFKEFQHDEMRAYMDRS